MRILNSFTEVDILYFGCMEFKILFDFDKKVKTPSCYFEKNLNTPLSFTLKKCLPCCILHRPCHTVNFSRPLIKAFQPGCKIICTIYYGCFSLHLDSLLYTYCLLPQYPFKFYIVALLHRTNCRFLDYKYRKCGHYTCILVQL